MSVVVFSLPRSLTHDDAHTVSAAISGVLEQAQSATGTGKQGATNPAERCLRLDAQALEHIDSAALAVVLQAQRDARTRGWTVTVDPVPPRLLQLAQMYGVDGLLRWPG